MMSFLRHFYKNRSLFFIERTLCRQSDSTTKISKGSMITTSIKLYLTKCREKETMMENEKKQFEFGRRYLAKMMGGDPETFDQNDIDESIRYLFPSGLFEPEARPVMKDPTEIYPLKKPLECDENGRPYNTFYYTARPVFYSIMLKAVYILEHLKSLEDKRHRLENVPGEPLQLLSSKWMSQNQLADLCMEKVRNQQYEDWVNIMDAVLAHPFASEAKDFILTMRVPVIDKKKKENRMELLVDPETGRKYIETYGQKKWSIVEVRLYMPGDGKISINDKKLLEVIPALSNREAILFPLKFTDTVGKVDIVAQVNGEGTSCVALALRLAISRALACFLPDEEVTRLEVAGLLTQDDRYKERKKPGLRGARKRPIWRKR